MAGRVAVYRHPMFWGAAVALDWFRLQPAMVDEILDILLRETRESRRRIMLERWRTS